MRLNAGANYHKQKAWEDSSPGKEKKHVTSTGEGGKGEESLMSRTKESENIVLGLYSLF